MPELVRGGHIYATVAPLFKILYNNTYEYAMTNEERDKIINRIKNKYKYTVLRYKGLGEMNAKDLRDTMIDPANRTLLQYTVEDEALVNETFSKLMGVDSTPRKTFLETDTL